MVVSFQQYSALLEELKVAHTSCMYKHEDRAQRNLVRLKVPVQTVELRKKGWAVSVGGVVVDLASRHRRQREREAGVDGRERREVTFLIVFVLHVHSNYT